MDEIQKLKIDILTKLIVARFSIAENPVRVDRSTAEMNVEWFGYWADAIIKEGMGCEKNKKEV